MTETGERAILSESDFPDPNGSMSLNVSEDFFLIYKKHLLPIYSDLVVLTVDKPSPILLEIEAAFKHLMKYVMNEDAETNLKKAKGHVYRASVDCYKLMWEFIYETVTAVDLHRGAYEGNEADLLTKLRELFTILSDARLAEEESVGAENEEVLDLWKNAIKIGLDIYGSTNKSLLKRSIRRTKYSGPFVAYVFPAILCVMGALIGKFVL